jgi:hypothetical protein
MRIALYVALLLLAAACKKSPVMPEKPRPECPEPEPDDDECDDDEKRRAAR